MIYVLIAVGGALGAVARYGMAGWVQARLGTFPWGTMAVNVLGSFLLGFGLRYLEAAAVPPEWRAGITVGLLGAFTTFSTFSHETIVLVQDGDWGRAAVYALGSVALGVMAVLAGLGAGHAYLRWR